MSNNLSNLLPDEYGFWSGIGNHFENFTQIMNEFIDNSLANFETYDCPSRNIFISLEQKQDGVLVSIEDTGTGINDLRDALTIGNNKNKKHFLNEHGFGLKNALAAGDPGNVCWKILTRSSEDLERGEYRLIEAPYNFKNIPVKTVDSKSEGWPGVYTGSGTLVSFVCPNGVFETIRNGVRGRNPHFETYLELLAEDLGYFYSGIIKKGRISISIKSGEQQIRVSAIEPLKERNYKPAPGAQEEDLGAGVVSIEYEFLEMRDPKKDRKLRDYYNVSGNSSGIEIRINGRLMKSGKDLIKRIWNRDPANFYNKFLGIINVVSDDVKAIPKTVTSKTGISNSDIKFNNLLSFIRKIKPEPNKLEYLGVKERQLVDRLERQKKVHTESKNLVLEREYSVFRDLDLGNHSPRADLYYYPGHGKPILYECKKKEAAPRDVYQAAMYEDGARHDGGGEYTVRLVSKKISDDIRALVNWLNDERGYHIELRVWEEEGIDCPE